jgi:DNA-binding NarL/FixJ family response regulator
MSIKIGIVEDHASVRDGLAALIKMTPNLSLVGNWPDAETAIKEAPEREPDVVLMDINLPGQSGIECVSALKQKMPQCQMLMLTIEENSNRVFDSLAAGAAGYLVKNVAPARILEAIEEVHRGGSPMSSHIARMVVQRFQAQGPSRRSEENLTAREEEILRLISKGFRAKEIADQLGISVYTVQTHVRNIYEKLHVRSRAEAVAKFLT